MAFAIGEPLTTKVTGTVCGELETPADAIATLALYVPSTEKQGQADSVNRLGAVVLLKSARRARGPGPASTVMTAVSPLRVPPPLFVTTTETEAGTLPDDDSK